MEFEVTILIKAPETNWTNIFDKAYKMIEREPAQKIQIVNIKLKDDKQ